MRKARFFFVALFAMIAVSAFAELPKAGDVGYLYNIAAQQYITATGTLGEEGVQFTIEIKEKDSSATPTVEGAKFMRFKTGSNYLTFYQEPVAMSTYYGQLVVKETENGLLITHPYPNDQGPDWITAGSYLQVVDGNLVCTALDEANEGAYWLFGTAEQIEAKLLEIAEIEANKEAEAMLGAAIAKAKLLLAKPMSAAAKTALETAISNAENKTDGAYALLMALSDAYNEANKSAIIYQGILASYESHKSFLEGDELEDYIDRLSDLMDDVEAGVVTENGLEEMAEIATVSLALQGPVEVAVFDYATECEVNKDYVPGGNHGITIDWDAIATALGVEKTGLKIYAVLPDGTLDETYGRGSAGTDGWRDAEGNWAGWNTADNLFYVQLTGQTLDGVGCMRTAEPTTYTATFKIVNAEITEGDWVTLNISLNVKAKEVDNTLPTSVEDLTIASTLKDVVTLKIGAGYSAGDGSSANVAAILAALGEESFDNVKIFAVQSDGSLDAEYKLGTTDGWRNADGDWAGWSDASSQFYVKADFALETAQLYEVGCHPEHQGVHLDDVVNYTAQYAFVVGSKSENKSVLYNVVVAVAPEKTDLDVTGATVQYFYNVEAKGFILGANNWNTRASIGAKGYQMHFENGNEGAYKLCASNQTGTSYAANDLDYDGNGDIWVDGAGRAGSGMWTYTVNADKTFTIASTYEPAKGLLSIVPSKNDTRLYMSEDPEAQSTWIAVSEQVYTAYSNKAILKEEAATLAEIKEFIESTNIYTPDAYETYYQMYADALDMNQRGEVVGNLDNPNLVHGWHASNAYDDYLLSAWTYNDAQCSEFNTSLYINTWSVEADGKENSSGMHVPFFEYWTGDANSLGAATLTGTVEGVTPGNYAVSALIRVRIKDNNTDEPYGITLSANEAEPIDVAAGRACGDGDQFRFNYSVVNGVTVGDDGILKINFNIAADNNISWLSFKNVKYLRATTPLVTEPATAIDEVNAKPAAAKTIFNAAGQQMKSLQKGLNIVDGKKVYVK